MSWQLKLSVFLVGMVVMTCLTPSLPAAQTVTRESRDDIELVYSTDWIGGQEGGYHPVRIQVGNRGPACQLTIQATRWFDEPVPEVSETIELEQNARSILTLNIPIVKENQSYAMKFYKNGRQLQGVGRTFTVPASSQGIPSPKMLIIHPTQIDWASFGLASETYQMKQQHVIPHGGTPQEDALVVEPGLLPRLWQGYLSCDLVAIDQATLAKLKSEERDPLVEWVQAGGQLIVFNVGQEASQRQQLDSLLELGSLSGSGDAWLNYEIGRAMRDYIIDSSPQAYSMEGSLEGESPQENPLNAQKASYQWSYDDAMLKRQPIMLGMAYAFAGNPFEGTYNDWATFLSSLPNDTVKSFSRLGVETNQAANDFLAFLIPSIRSVPVVPFMFLITIFSVVIGPLNYIYFQRRRQLAMMLVSVPLIAVMASLSLVAYSTIAHGFGIKARLRSITYLDQSLQKSVTKSRVSYFAGLAPSKGLVFSQQTAVLPVWLMDGEFNNGSVTWGDSQRWHSGWLKSRTRTQMVCVTPQDQRGRLVISGNGEDRMNVSNGFEFDVTLVLVPNKDGEMFVVRDLKAGDQVEAEKLDDFKKRTGMSGTDLVALLEPYAMEVPANVNTDAIGVGNIFGSRSSRYYGYHVDAQPSYYCNYKESQLESTLQGWKTALSTGAYPPTPGNPSAGRYLAVLEKSEFDDIGITSWSAESSFHLLVGVY